MLLLMVLGGCAGGLDDWCADPVEMTYAASMDSLGLAAFLDLTPEAQHQRRVLANLQRAEGQGSVRADLRVRAFTAAAGLVPDDPANWLDLARSWRAVGGDLQASASLTSAMNAVAGLVEGAPLWELHGEQFRPSMALLVSLEYAWLHYSRAEWHEAMRWTRAARRLEPGDERVLRLRGLLAGITGAQGVSRETADDLWRKDEFSTDAAWIRANQNLGQGFYPAAFTELVGLRPANRRASECYLDMGRVAERVARLDEAGRWYREAAAALPQRKTTCLIRHDGARISDLAGRHELPFWVAFGSQYVTGSLSAYLSFAFQQFLAATTPLERDRWGGLVVNAAGICVRLEMEAPYARRVRGLVFAESGRERLALSDLLTSVAGLGARHRWHGPLEARIGRLYLGLKEHADAAAHLRLALADQPGAADLWADLGLALIMLDETGEAEVVLTRAIDLDGTLTAAWYNRGLMHLHAGHREQALADLGRAARLAPDNMEIGRLLQRIQQP